MEENSVNPAHHGTPLLRILALLFFALLIAVISSLTTYYSLNKQYQPQLQSYQPPAPEIIPTVVPSLSPRTIPDETSKWKTYYSKYSFQVKYPTILEINDEFKYSVLFNAIQNEPGAPGFPTFYVSTIPNGYENKNVEVYNFISATTIDDFFKAKVNEIVAQGSNHDVYGNFKKLPNTSVYNQSAIVVENNNPWEYKGGKDRRVFIKRNGFTYMIGTYSQTNVELKNFELFLSTFKFTK